MNLRTGNGRFSGNCADGMDVSTYSAVALPRLHPTLTKVGTLQQRHECAKVEVRRNHFMTGAVFVNKLARTAWAVLAKGKAFDQVRWNPSEAVAA